MNSFKPNTLVAALALSFATFSATASTTTYAIDKTQSGVQWVADSKQRFNLNASGAEVLSYLKANSSQLATLEFELNQVQSSLLGNHYRYQQTYKGLPIFGKGLVVSLKHADGSLYKQHNYTTQSTVAPATSSSGATIDKHRALEAAWNFLQPSGKLLSTPKSQLGYFEQAGELKLAYKQSVEVNAPFGSWQLMVDAGTGKVLQAKRIDTPHKNHGDAALNTGKVTAFTNNKHLVDLKEALAELNQQQTNAQLSKSGYKVIAQGSGLVFDPDPRTTLNDENLSPAAAAATFDPAYFNVTLQDITENSGEYFLEGPWVTIIDFEAPTSRPSTTFDGTWTEKRGDLAFYDVMSYYHIDQNQRYLQSLGFTGGSAIQNGPIEVDSNGVNGADNSYYLPASNRLAFGHGGVPDNEDVDVILHEYGHAINYGINNWEDGDTGAIGEGFGDYWAGSYSYSTPNGQSFSQPDWVYTWDGHNEFFEGRILNQTLARYDASQNYGAHQIVNGFNGDELWSTPLFQSLKELMAAGVDREEVDQIIIEAQFGLNKTIKMPDMANSIVETAKELFPSGEHSNVFYRWFNTMEILANPIELGTPATLPAGENEAPDPGETIFLKLPLVNSSPSDATQVVGTLSTTNGFVTFTQNQGEYPTITTGTTGQAITDYEFTIGNSFACGAPIDMSLDVDYELLGETRSDTFDFTIYTGSKILVQNANTTAVAIPDNDPTGITSTITMSGLGTLIDDQFGVDLNITHTWRGDLTVTLTSPQGTSVILWDSDQNDGTENVIGRFPNEITPVGNFADFNGEDLNGEWTLTVVDTAAEDTGTLNSWGIDASSEATCDAIPTEDENESTRDILIGLAAIILIGMEYGGSLSIFSGLLLLLALRKRQKQS